jgi:hypothetical protein
LWRHKGFDLIVMGRPEGAGCYCAANTLLTNSMDRLVKNYAYVVMDNEAGMEHISRLTTNNVNLLLVVSDPTRRGIQAASRIHALTDELSLKIEKKCLVVNRAKEGQEEEIRKRAREFDLDPIGIIPEDPLVQQFDLEGRPTTELTGESLALESGLCSVREDTAGIKSAIYRKEQALISRYREFSTRIEGVLFIGKKCLTTPPLLNMVGAPQKEAVFISLRGQLRIFLVLRWGTPIFQADPKRSNQDSLSYHEGGPASLPGQDYFPVSVWNEGANSPVLRE